MCVARRPLAALALGRLQVQGLIPLHVPGPMRQVLGLTFCAAGLCNSPLLQDLHQTHVAVTTVATAGAAMLGALCCSQSRAKGSGSVAMAFCSSKFTQPVRLTPIGFLRSTSAITLGSIRTLVAAS